MSDNDPSSVLNSKCIEEVSFVLTGFGKFGNITENPTTTLKLFPSSKAIDFPIPLEAPVTKTVFICCLICQEPDIR